MVQVNTTVKRHRFKVNVFTSLVLKLATNGINLNLPKIKSCYAIIKLYQITRTFHFQTPFKLKRANSSNTFEV